MHARTLEAAAALAGYYDGDPDFTLMPSFRWPDDGVRFIRHAKRLGPPFDSVKKITVYPVQLGQPPSDLKPL